MTNTEKDAAGARTFKNLLHYRVATSVSEWVRAAYAEGPLAHARSYKALKLLPLYAFRPRQRR